jgi:hypothetical protein
MKDKLGIIVLIICIVVVEASVAYIWTNITVENTKQEMESKLLVNISSINISSRNGTLMFKIVETNESMIKEIGPVVYIGLFNKNDVEIRGEQPEFNNIWKIMVANATEHDVQLIQELTIGQNYTIWYIDYTGFAKAEGHVSLRTNVLVDVEHD